MPKRRSSSAIVLFPEIWPIVFSHLHSSDLQSASLTCSSFRYIAQFLLFSVLDVSPILFLFVDENPPPGRSHAYLQRFLQRLEQYKLPHLVHAVRHCWISPWSGNTIYIQGDEVNPNIIIDALVGALPLFVNLSKLSWHCVDIYPQWWKTIQALPITNVWLTSSSLSLESPLPFRCVKHLDLDHFPYERRVKYYIRFPQTFFNSGVSEATLRLLIQPDVIQYISVPKPDTAHHLLSILSKAGPNNLRTLKIPYSSIADANFILALEYCVTLISLCIIPFSLKEIRNGLNLDIPASLVPLLAHYEGPNYLLSHFSHHHLQSISLWGFDEQPWCSDTEALTNTIIGLSQTNSANTLSSLNVNVNQITSDLLVSFAPFTRLTHIGINPQNEPFMLHDAKSAYVVTSLYSLLNSISFPPNIKELTISTHLFSSVVELSQQERDASCFMESFALRYPSLQRIEICYGVTVLYSSAWGRIRENDVADLNEIPGNNDNAIVSAVRPLLPLGKSTFNGQRSPLLGPQTAGENPNDGPARLFWPRLWLRLKGFLSCVD